MTTSLAKQTDAVRACKVRFDGDRLAIELSDSRELIIPYHKIPWLNWLAQATPEQRADWSIEPNGYAVYWNQLDDGIEISHLLAVESLA